MTILESAVSFIGATIDADPMDRFLATDEDVPLTELLDEFLEAGGFKVDPADRKRGRYVLLTARGNGCNRIPVSNSKLENSKNDLIARMFATTLYGNSYTPLGFDDLGDGDNLR